VDKCSASVRLPLCPLRMMPSNRIREGEVVHRHLAAASGRFLVLDKGYRNGEVRKEDLPGGNPAHKNRWTTTGAHTIPEAMTCESD